MTDTIDLTHLDVNSVLSILRDHADPSPHRLLFLWNLFEGVPKFYRDCYEQGVLSADRPALLRRIFFESSSPLRTEADQRLEETEGGALEKLAGQLYEERSRKQVGDFPLTQRIQGYWDRSDTEIDLVAVNEVDEVIRFGSCKRSPQRLLSDVNNFKGHVGRFLDTMPRYQEWEHQYVGIAPVLDADQRVVLARHDVIPQDLTDLTSNLD